MSRKNPFKGAIILTVFAVLTVGLYLLLSPYFEKASDRENNATLLLGGLGREEVYELRIKNESGTFNIKKLGDKKDVWSVSEETNPTQTYEADTSSVNGIISTILAARKEGEVSQIKLNDVGLQPPRYEVQITHANGTQLLLLGLDTPVEYLVYAKWSDDSSAFLTSRSLKFGIDKTLSEIRNKKVFDLQLSSLKSIKWDLSQGLFNNARGLNLQKDEQGQWAEYSRNSIPVLSQELNNFLDTLNKQNIKEFVSEDPSKLAEFGLNRPQLTLTLQHQSSEIPNDVWLFSQKEKNYFMTKQGHPTIYEINASTFDHFNVDLIKFRDTKIADLNTDTVKEIRIEFPKNQTLILTKTDQGWKSKENDSLLAAKEDKIHEILSKLSELKATEFFDGQTPAQTGLDKPNRIVDITYEQNSEKKNRVYFFGKKLGDELYSLNTEGLVAAASVKLNLEEVLPDTLDSYRTPKVGISKEPAAQSNDPKQKGNNTKMEPTVSSPKDVRKLPASIVKPGHKYTAKIVLSNGKTLEVLFESEKAPYTVSNFLHLARNKFYDGVVFHRVIPDFVVQGGDPTGTGTGGPGYKFDNEDNDLKHLRGALSMAHAGRNTNGSQFFIVLAPQPHLNGLHTVFGNVTKGQEFLDEIPQGTKMTQVEVFEEAL